MSPVHRSDRFPVLRRWFCSGALLVLAGMPWPAAAQLVADRNQRIFQNEVGGAIEAGDRFGQVLVAGDFDGDGIEDLAIAAPGEHISTIASAGAVFVIYGSGGGLGAGARPPLVLHQDVAGVEGQSEVGDRFGSVLASGDFNGDGKDELVVGIPDEDVGTLIDAGAIQVFLGTSGGLTTLGDVLFTRDSFAAGDFQGRRFGAALATGLFIGDDHLDLLIGAPAGALAPGERGAVFQVGGSSSGLFGNGDAFRAFVGTSEAGDEVGTAVAAGDVDDDGAPGDLIYGGPRAGDANEGAVWTSSEVESGYVPVPLGPTTGSYFGSSIVLGDFRGAGYPQLLIGAPNADVDMVQDSGAAVVFDQPDHRFVYLTQDPALSFGTPDPFDHFGGVLAVGDFDDDGYDDAVFGVPHEDLSDGGGGDVAEAGFVQVLYGSTAGLSFADNQSWALNLLGFTLFADDNFGGALAAGDFDGDGVDDLAIGVPGAVLFGETQTGFVQVLYGFSESVFADAFESGDTAAWSSSAP